MIMITSDQILKQMHEIKFLVHTSHKADWHPDCVIPQIIKQNCLLLL